MTRTTPDPLKQMRQKQATEAKLLAAQNITERMDPQGTRKDQSTKGSGKASQRRTPKNPKPPENTTTKDKLPDPSQTAAVDPKILPEAETPDKVTTPEGDVAEVSLDYTLSEEGEGDNISGNKELRDEAEHVDENISKRLKKPLNPDATE
jgi:hypothetical protein